ncbi:MAG: hypothetical protein HZC38_19570 [Chloroflexi bacterium]|nr:hypothetical protein [Chloroflexota bacterium]MBI5082006.1 hypothetical protein [Chloroflexota bacterium]MBI5715603.1 hypothetical protein [Chloroflexota bacterium]
MFVVFGGGYAGALYLMDYFNPFTNIQHLKGLDATLVNLIYAAQAAPYQPHSVALGLSLLVSLFFFAIISIVWAIVRVEPLDPHAVKLTDVAKAYGKTKKRNIRKCR